MHFLLLSELRKPSCWLAWGLLLASAHASPAQTLARRSFTTANGLLQSSVYCLAQDYEGRLWAGTQAEACRYDGQELRSYGGKQGLANTHVRAVAPAPNEPTV